MALDRTSPAPVGWNIGPRIRRPRMKGINTVTKMIAARPRLPSRKCPDPGTTQARTIAVQGERVGTAVLALTEVAGIHLNSSEPVGEAPLKCNTLGSPRRRVGLRRFSDEVCNQLANPAYLTWLDDQISAICRSIGSKNSRIIRPQRDSSGSREIEVAAIRLNCLEHCC